MNFDNKIPTRQSYGEALISLGRENENVVVLDADLSNATKTGNFKKEFPDRFFNMGIAEADMLATAAGLATCGKIPFASTFAVFATGRAYDQIRNSICYPKLNVKICGTHSRNNSWRRWSNTSDVRRYKSYERVTEHDSIISC